MGGGFGSAFHAVVMRPPPVVNKNASCCYHFEALRCQDSLNLLLLRNEAGVVFANRTPSALAVFYGRTTRSRYAYVAPDGFTPPQVHKQSGEVRRRCLRAVSGRDQLPPHDTQRVRFYRQPGRGGGGGCALLAGVA
eukprot:1185446-Prorocentrum_minimum.AAC.2